MNNEMCGCGTEEKTSSAIGLVKINYKQDFELVVELLAGDKPYQLGDEDFRIDFMVMASRYTVGRTAGVCERCSVDGNKVRCFMDGHGLPPGELRAEVKVNTPDPNYADGKRLNVAIAEGTVVLVKDNTRFDGAVVKANIPVALVDAYQLAKAHGYKGTIDEYYDTFTEIGDLKENIKGTLNEMTEAEKLRATAETERAKAETERQSNRDKFNTAESERVKNEQQRQTTEEQRQQSENERVSAESNRANAEIERAKAEQQRSSTDELWKTAEQQRIQAETQRQTAEELRKQAEEDRQKNRDRFNAAEEERKQAEAERQKNRDRFNDAEDARVAAEKQRNDAEQARKKDEQQRQTNEEARNTAETERATAEGKRAGIDKERDELVAKMQAAWKEIERMKNLREGEYGKEIELVEKIKNAAKIPTQNVWLDVTNGEIKSSPASEGINANAYKYYYIGRREVVGNGGRFTNKYLRSLDLSNWNTQAMTSAGNMFENCSSLQSIDVSNWNTQSLTSTYAMFAGCSSLQSIDVSNWNTQSLTSLRAMFSGCTALRLLDFRKANFSHVKDTFIVFGSCTALAELWLPLTFDLLTSIDLSIPSWGATPEGLASLRWTFGEGADDRTAKGLQPCTVRLDRSVYDRLTDEERTAAAKKGWTTTK